MAVKTKKWVLYHVPKTGGIYAKEAIMRTGLRYGRCRDKSVGHKELRNEFKLEREHSIPAAMWPEEVKGLFSFCFVRHPVTWYKSIWSFRAMHQVRNMKFPVDRHWVPDYEEFVVSMLDAYPRGFVTKLFQYYVGESGDRLDFVGRQENLTNDLVTALTLAGETFDEQLLRGTKKYNVSKKSAVALSEETQDRVLEVEKWVVDNFYG